MNQNLEKELKIKSSNEGNSVKKKNNSIYTSKIAIRIGIEIIRDDSETRENQHKTILGKSRQVI